MAVQGNPYREAAKDELEKIRQDEIQRWIYLREEMAISDERSRMKTAELQGRSAGFAAGLAEGRSAGLEEGHLTGLAEGRITERTENVKSTIQMLKSMGQSKEEIVENLMKFYTLSQKDAEKMIHDFWEN